MTKFSARTVAKLDAICAEFNVTGLTFENYEGDVTLYSVETPDGLNCYDWQVRAERHGFEYLEMYTLNTGQPSQESNIVREYDGQHVADLFVTLRAYLELVRDEIAAKSVT